MLHLLNKKLTKNISNLWGENIISKICGLVYNVITHMLEALVHAKDGMKMSNHHDPKG
jgi:hypothetical protein